MSLKDNLKQMREKAGFAQAKDFAKVAGIPYSSYAVYERGSWPNESNLIKIATALHVSVDDLLGYAPEQPDKAECILDFFRRLGYTADRYAFTPLGHTEKVDGYSIHTKEGRPFTIMSDSDLERLYNRIVFSKQIDNYIRQQRYMYALELLIQYEAESVQEYRRISAKAIPHKEKGSYYTDTEVANIISRLLSPSDPNSDDDYIRSWASNLSESKPQTPLIDDEQQGHE